MAKVVMYSSRLCPYCFRAKSVLESKQADLEIISVDGQPKVREEMMQKSGRHTVPQIWIGEQHIGGCDDLIALDRRGELDSLLEA